MIHCKAADILVIGYGNPGRLDDGLGPALAENLQQRGLPGVAVDSDYQLTVEHASDIARHDVVLFADADVSAPAPFRMHRIYPMEAKLTFSSHSISPEGVLTMARDLFKAEPETWIIGIRGYDFSVFTETLSLEADNNLQQAVKFVEESIRSDRFRESTPVRP